MRIMWLNVILFLYIMNTNGVLRYSNFALDYFENKQVPYLCYLTCASRRENKKVVDNFIRKGIRTSVQIIDEHESNKLEKNLYQWNVPVGVLLDGSCKSTEITLERASRSKLFDAMHMWLILENLEGSINSNKKRIEDILQYMNLSIDADIVIAKDRGDRYDLMDVFNFGKIQGNNLEKKFIGTWSGGLNVSLNRFKYYDRWDFHNLTLRAVTVLLDRPKVFKPEILYDLGYTEGVSYFTKIVNQLLWILKDIHNFRFNYTIAGRWVGSPKRNSTLGVGDYENRFLTPLSAGAWWCTIVACVACTLILAATAVLENREEPGLYAAFSVFALICQQAYEDGVQIFEEATSSQGRRLILLVVGLMSMLLYNYYTSSVVSWLLNAAAPTLANIDALINSDLELVFEDIGYTRGWLDSPGFFYYSGYKNPKEDILRMKKVTNARRTTSLLQPAVKGIELIRTGDYAYHTEPYTAYQVISKRFEDRELCELGSLQMIPPAKLYIMGQKRSPYKQFFVWSLIRMLERGHTSAARARVSGFVPTCSGSTPRALALGQAAPAFAILAQVAVFSLLILVCEIYWHRLQLKKQIQLANNSAHNAQEARQE